MKKKTSKTEKITPSEARSAYVSLAFYCTDGECCRLGYGDSRPDHHAERDMELNLSWGLDGSDVFPVEYARHLLGGPEPKASAT